MNEIKITDDAAKAALKVASGETKQVLLALFGNQVVDEEKQHPTLDDYKTIKSYEDACEALDLSPILNDSDLNVCSFINQHYDFRSQMPKHIVALMKLETISRALWGKDFEPKPDADGSEIYYYPWFYLFTQSEIDNFSEEERKRGALLAADAHNGANAGFGSLPTGPRSSNSDANLGFRLCQENEEKARYFGTQFIDLWAEYLKFNFTVGERIF